ncbi:MAG: c-type cytochrome [Phenylobacterium sp.]
MRALDLRIAAAALAIAGLFGVQSAGAQPTGEQLYNDNCAACHQKAGQGIPGAFPALKGDKIALGDEKTVAFLLLTGRGGMPAFKDSLSDGELATIMTYVRAAWGNKGKAIAPAIFAKARTGPPPSTRLQAH